MGILNSWQSTLMVYVTTISVVCSSIGPRSYDIPIIGGKPSEKLPESIRSDPDTEEEQHHESMKADQISLMPGSGMEETPEYKGGLFDEFIVEERRVKHFKTKESVPSIPNSSFYSVMPEDIPTHKDSIRVRRELNIEDPVPAFTYSEWGSWSACFSVSCHTPGIQIKHRTCYTTNLVSAIPPCKYENLVRERNCIPEGCKDTIHSWSKWSSWGLCSITCGKDGLQERVRSCITENGTTVQSQDNCEGSSSDFRVCQYSTSCPKWDEWSAWTTCSRTCGQEGIITRKRNCVSYRYYVSGTEVQDDSLGMSVHKSFGSIAETDSSNLGAIIHHDWEPIFVVDAYGSAENATYFSEDIMKEAVIEELCLRPGDSYQEKMECSYLGDCPSFWTAWGNWSACHRGCAPGFRKRTRRCIVNSKDEPCEGQSTSYRRCYPPPCWGKWSNVGSCSATCGDGIQRRTRECNIYSNIPPLNRCIGDAKDVINCTLPICTAVEKWTQWSPFTRCTLSCGRGYQFRNRTCLTDKCLGMSNEVIACNKQRCPKWSRWQPLSCCSASCGLGFTSKSRTCLYGKGCRGESTQVFDCYSQPCDGLDNATLDNISCGKQPSFLSTRVARTKIINGETAAPHAWPWQGSWQKRENISANWEHFCGVVLIHPRWVVTAAHCNEELRYLHRTNPMEPDTRFPDLFSVILGTNDVYNGGTRFKIFRYFGHKEYSFVRVALNDVALLKLGSPATISESISPICLPGNWNPKPGEPCKTAGWGFTKPEGSYSTNLLEASTPHVNHETCLGLGRKYREYLDENVHLCAGRTTGNISDTCEGDSGGSLSCKNGNNWHMAGITSFSFTDCGTPGHVGIYTRVATFQKWIKKTVEEFTYDNC